MFCHPFNPRCAGEGARANSRFFSSFFICFSSSQTRWLDPPRRLQHSHVSDLPCAAPSARGSSRPEKTRPRTELASQSNQDAQTRAPRPNPHSHAVADGHGEDDRHYPASPTRRWDNQPDAATCFSTERCSIRTCTGLHYHFKALCMLIGARDALIVKRDFKKRVSRRSCTQALSSINVVVHCCLSSAATENKRPGLPAQGPACVGVPPIRRERADLVFPPPPPPLEEGRCHVDAAHVMLLPFRRRRSRRARVQSTGSIGALPGASPIVKREAYMIVLPCIGTF
ncbi:hypothetical protein LZ32DRAFT_378878 [Colletotrichum eremochloae]|nr:hypothetical protein LZ32DRAFT_378878 [Colletotrichum eremochloae]